MQNDLDQLLDEMPIIAILRGVKPEEVIDHGRAVYESGIRVIEVPLNSPHPYESIRQLSIEFGDDCLIGCGTLLEEEQAKRVADAGGQIAVTPNTRQSVIKKCLELDIVPIPGWSTPSEAFLAYRSGARHLKLFPASSYGPGHITAIRAVMPKDAKILAVGGVGANNAKTWFDAGASGIGISSEIYKAGLSPDEVSQRCKTLVQAIKETNS